MLKKQITKRYLELTSLKNLIIGLLLLLSVTAIAQPKNQGTTQATEQQIAVTPIPGLQIFYIIGLVIGVAGIFHVGRKK